MISRRGTGGCGGGTDWESRYLGGGTVGRAVPASRPPHWDNGHLARCGSGRACRGPTGVPPVDTYGLAHDTPEPEIVAHLFKLYAEKVKA